jgi:hypothetical protein
MSTTRVEEELPPNMNGRASGQINGAAQGNLTPHQRHYLAKMLGQLAMSRGRFLRLVAFALTFKLFPFYRMGSPWRSWGVDDLRVAVQYKSCHPGQKFEEEAMARTPTISDFALHVPSFRARIPWAERCTSQIMDKYNSTLVR